MERRPAEIDAIHGEARGLDAQGQDDRRAREGVAFEVCVSMAANRWEVLLTRPV